MMMQSGREQSVARAVVAHGVQPHGKPRYDAVALGAGEGRRWSTWKPRESAVACDLPASRWDWDEADWLALRGEELRWLADAAAARAAAQH
jgi:hypothetical protein